MPAGVYVRAPMTEQAKKIRSLANRGKMTGSQHHNWKGGVTPENKRFKNTAEYREWREAVFTRDNHTCVMCGKQGGELHPDHIKPVCAFPELRLDLDNGRTLCAECHRKTDTWGTNSRYYK